MNMASREIRDTEPFRGVAELSRGGARSANYIGKEDRLSSLKAGKLQARTPGRVPGDHSVVNRSV
jgi:hypothetical protein